MLKQNKVANDIYNSPKKEKNEKNLVKSTENKSI